MELRDVSNAWRSAGQKLPAGLQSQVSQILAGLPKDDGKLDDFAADLKTLDDIQKKLVPGAVNSIAAAITKKEVKDVAAGKNALQVVQEIRGVVLRRMDAIRRLQQDVNAGLKEMVDAGRAFLDRENPEMMKKLGVAVSTYKSECCKKLVRQESGAIGEEVWRTAIKLLEARARLPQSDIDSALEELDKRTKKHDELTREMLDRLKEYESWTV